MGAVYRKAIGHFPQRLQYSLIVLRLMGEGAIGAYLNPLPFLFHISGISFTLFQRIQGTIAEQAVKVR